MAKAPTLKMPKLPKALGACVDLYKDWSVKRLAEQKGVEAIADIEKAIKNHIIDNLTKGNEGAVGARYKAIAYNAPVYQVEDWPKFYKHLQKTGEFELLNRAINQAAVQERVDAQERPAGKRGENWKPKLPPGIVAFTAVKLSVTKK